MAYTNFKTIPAEAVVTDEATWTVIRSIIKCPENMEVCKACMDVIQQKYTGDTNPYKAQAYRRAAILVANVDFPLISQKGKEALSLIEGNQIGLPQWGSTTEYVRNYVEMKYIKNLVTKNINECFPPEWRNEQLKYDARINVAVEVIDFFMSKPHLWQMNSWSADSIQEAFKFYLKFSRNETKFLQEKIYDFLRSN